DPFHSPWVVVAAGSVALRAQLGETSLVRCARLRVEDAARVPEARRAEPELGELAVTGPRAGGPGPSAAPRDQLERMHLRPRLAREPRNVAQPTCLPQPELDPFIGDRPVLAVLAEDIARRRRDGARPRARPIGPGGKAQHVPRRAPRPARLGHGRRMRAIL